MNASNRASEVLVKLCLEEGAEIQEQRFSSTGDTREDEVIHRIDLMKPAWPLVGAAD